jgi:hypothetical protein
MVVLVLAGPLHAEICGPGARLDYPMSEVLTLEANGYVATAIMATDFDTVDPLAQVPYASAYVTAVEARRRDLPPALADLPYLIALSDVAEYPDPIYSLTYMAQSVILPQMIEALERQGMEPEAALLRAPMLAFPDWDAGPDARYRVAEAFGHELPGLKGQALRLASDTLRRSASRIQMATEALLASDPKVAAEYAAKRQSTDADMRVQYLAYRLIVECLADWWTADEADVAFAGMARTQRDILLLHFFLAESFNGSTHQYFYNSSGTMAPQLADLLDRIGLPDHAAGIRQGMSMFPSPYPRDTDTRREVMLKFTEAQDDALYQLTVWADDGKVSEAMQRLVTEAGLMPQ